MGMVDHSHNGRMEIFRSTRESLFNGMEWNGMYNGRARMEKQMEMDAENGNGHGKWKNIHVLTYVVPGM